VFFAGPARWMEATREQGWAYFALIELASSLRRDSVNVLVRGGIVKIGFSGRMQQSHFGAPCSSLSVAITPSWRSAEFPQGFP
jgi:hypothetical protein